MRRHLVAAAAAAGLLATATAVPAQPFPARGPMLQPAQASFYYWGGRRYCWYDNGWTGPGWYWCGYPWRSGFGWGGPWGWHGWVGGHPRGWYQSHRGFYGGRWVGGGWHGGHGGGWHGGGNSGWHGGGHGDWRGGGHPRR